MTEAQLAERIQAAVKTGMNDYRKLQRYAPMQLEALIAHEVMAELRRVAREDMPI